ncbi:SMI1/KNR4 family protein [Paenibacillus sp. SEL3]|uniref:SMI1/KNR4 family protein n=1 Tax=Paenibacillus ottowii TaxID=2315729 RepID=UPI00142C72A8|nr:MULTISPECIES: SMI1/KNR4 family protein [Paenibacillus]MDP1509333.1 SMI1/KNR4 family protein [Paenibacillus ottowii]MEC4564540.1 SMI1/KNR4 family protein [Paenibacillus sp. CMAA1739]NEU28803.1 SMI1/KNR4 family protein [Paenibacillus polymyxa]
MKTQNESIIFPLPDSNLIMRVEENFEIKFPNDFINFISKNNGAIPITRFFEYKSNRYVVDRFLCLLDNPGEHDKGMYDIKVVFSQLDERILSDGDITGAELVPFAALFAGDFVCLDFSESKTDPVICIWYNEESDEYDPVTEKIADNVNSFLDMLEE